MGWKRHEDDKWEEDISYDERMAGMMTLFSVLTRLPLSPKYFGTVSHPLPLSENWKMMARLLNQPKEQLTNTHFTVASSWWEASANEIIMNYGRQGQKLLEIIWTQWVDSVADKKFTSANTLRIIGEDWKNSGTLKTLTEMEP